MVKMNDKKSFSKMLIRSEIKKHILLLTAVLILSIAIVILSLVNPVVYQKVVDNFIPGKNVKELITCIFIIVLVPIISALVSLLNNKLNFKFGQKCVSDFAQVFFKKLLYSDYSQFSKYDSVILSNMLTRSADMIPSSYLSSLVNSFTSLIQFVAIFSILIHYNAVITISAFIAVPLLYLVINSQKSKLRSVAQIGLKSHRNFQKSLIQTFNGMKTIRSYNAQSKMEESFHKDINARYDAEWIYKRVENIACNVLPTAVTQLVVGVIFLAGAIFVIKDKMSIGALIAIIAYLPPLMSSFNGILSAKLKINAVGDILKELDSLMEMDSELSSSVLPDSTSKTTFSMKNVDFSYDRENFSLHIDDLKINKGEFVVIVGMTGGGKSSVMDILNKFFPLTSGNVTAFGKDINKVDTNLLRKLYSVVFQDKFMFNDTIESNISFPEKPDHDKIHKTIKKARLDDFINGLPENEKTVISDYGANLSGGECQRISLARALYRDAPVMLLDEPTSALDAETSKNIFDMLSAESKENGKTIVAITHDIKKAFYADKVIVINEGNVAEYGYPNELLNTNGAFNSLYLAQNTNSDCGF